MERENINSNNENSVPEIWKTVDGYEGLYEVSNQGKIRSLMHNGKKRKEPYIMNPHIQKNGYAYVGLWKDGKARVFRFHRVVAKSFIPNPNNLPCVNHIDENKANNKVSNLEWCTIKYNDNYGTKNKRTSMKKSIPVGKYDENGNLLKKYYGLNEAARQEGLSVGNICEVCNGRRKHTGGYIWRFLG